MKKHYLLLVTVICGVLLLTGCSNKIENDFEGGGASYSVDVKNNATNTQASLPVKVLDANAKRKYARIENVSDTAVFLYMGYSASAIQASTSVLLDQGIRLNTVGTVGSVFEINDLNNYKGELWATSTASSKKLLIIEK